MIRKRPAGLSYTLSLLRIPVAVASRPAAWCSNQGVGMRASASRMPTLKRAHPPYPMSLQGGRTCSRTGPAWPGDRDGEIEGHSGWRRKPAVPVQRVGCVHLSEGACDDVHRQRPCSLLGSRTHLDHCFCFKPLRVKFNREMIMPLTM